MSSTPLALERTRAAASLVQWPCPVDLDAMPIGRVAQLVLLVCLVLDFVHPWAPGVFYFEGDQLFVDGAVRLGTPKLSKPAIAPAPQPALRIDDPDRATAQTWSSGSDALRPSTRRTERRYSSRSTDRSSPPSASPDAH